MNIPFLKRGGVKWTIAKRLGVLAGTVIGGFIALGVVYWLFASANADARHELDSLSDFEFEIEEVDIHLLTATIHEKDFLAKPSDQLVQAFADEMQAAYATLDKAASHAPSRESTAQIETLRAKFSDYEDAFGDVVRFRKEMGFDDDSGLLGELRAAVHEVEKILSSQGDIELIASMLTMRRHEKDFLRRGDAKYVERMANERRKFDSLLLRSDMSRDKAAIRQGMKIYHDHFLKVVEDHTVIAQALQKQHEAYGIAEPLLKKLEQSTLLLVKEGRKSFDEDTRAASIFFEGAMLALAIPIAFMLWSTFRAVNRPIGALRATLAKIAGGDRLARANLKTGDELQEVGDALDGMMEEAGQYMQTAGENEALNNSVMSLMRSVSALGRGDLTSEAPVAEDITGALGDALNQMADNMGKTLANVNMASEKVLSGAVTARDATAQSRGTVLGTVGGMNAIRDTIQETAKRIKRLGERSQEIGGIVKVIDTIAERTNVLALNANMQAAQAGEAGRGFMVVAAEVQRLAESAKESTDQISKLISGIQVETGEATAAMDRSIQEVVSGSKLAEKGAAEMDRTDEAVATLAALGNELQAEVAAFTLKREHQIEQAHAAAA